MTPTAATPPVDSERGTMLQDGATTYMPSATASGAGMELYDVDEHVASMRWPDNLDEFDRMRRSDGKVKSLTNAVTYAIRRRHYEIDPNGAADVDVRRVAEDLGLPIMGSEAAAPSRPGAKFNHDEHLSQALLGLWYGSYWFEQVGEVVTDEAGKAWRLHKLSPRPTRTLRKIRVNDDGSLAGITQQARNGRDLIHMNTDIIVGFVWEREGANWHGNSMLRAAYRAFKLKDDLLRADAAGKRRNALGIPVFNPGANANPKVLAEYNRIGRKLDSGQQVSVTLHAADASLNLVGVTGTLADALESVRYHDEEIASVFLAMWMQLGQTPNGSRALGETMLDVFNAGLDTIADDWYCGAMNDYVIADYGVFNYGPDHGRPMPKLVSKRVESPELAVADLIAALNAGLVINDNALRADFRGNYNLAPQDDPNAEPPAAPAPAPTLSLVPPPVDQTVAAAHKHEHDVWAGALDNGPATRDRWRQLTSREINAGIDPHGMDQRWRDAVARIIAAWSAVREEQIASIVRDILDAKGNLAQLANFYVPTKGADILHAEMVTIARAAAAGAAAEAETQGVKLAATDLTVVEARLQQTADAIATILANELGTSAARNAIRLTGPTATPEDVAAGVAAALRDLSPATLAKQITGALTTAQNTARRETFTQGPTPAQIIATEIMDQNTCDPCAEVDGTEYETIDDAEADYPSGGYVDCEGQDLCRGFYFVEYETNVSAARRFARRLRGKR